MREGSKMEWLFVFKIKQEMCVLQTDKINAPKIVNEEIFLLPILVF